LVTPTLGVASATSVNKVALTAPATSATLTLANGSTLATSGAFSQTLTATATTAVTLPTSGTIMSSVTALSGAVTGTPSSTTYLRGDATWATVSGGGGTPGGSNTQVQYNSSGSFAGSANFVFDGNNVGIGVTPSAFDTVNALQILNGSIYGYSTNETGFSQNAYYGSANWRYISTSAATAYRQVAGAHYWYIAPSGTAGNVISFGQSMTLNTSGNLGIGTSTPNANTGTALVVYHSATPRIRLTNSTTGQTASDGAELSISSSDLYIENRESANTIFYNGGSEIMRVASFSQSSMANGLQIGGTNNAPAGSTSKLVVTDNFTNGYGFAVVSTQSASFVGFANFVVGSAQVGSITFNGSTTVLNPTSDIRLKENIVDSGSGLAKLTNVKIRAFNWKESGIHTDFGVIAQELYEVAPECVKVGTDEINEDGGLQNPWGAQAYVLVPAVIKAIQELSALVTAQSATITSLTERITALEGK
jgi:hypothetical protein